MSGVKIEIRRAKEEDWLYIKEKIQKYLLDATNTSWQQFFVLKSDAKTVAFSRLLDHKAYFEIASLGVDYYYRKKGFGTKMLEFLIEEAKRISPEKPIYGVTHKPEFLQNVGFEEVSEYPEYLDYKKNHICKYPFKIKILRYKEKKKESAGVSTFNPRRFLLHLFRR